MNTQISLNDLQQQALNSGYALSTPLVDMYGGYECCLENLNTGQVNVVMNHKTPIEAAQAALGAIIRVPHKEYEFAEATA